MKISSIRISSDKNFCFGLRCSLDLENPLTLGIDCLLSEENGNRIRLKKWITEIKEEHRTSMSTEIE